MLNNYFKTALRNLLKYKNHSLISDPAILQVFSFPLLAGVVALLIALATVSTQAIKAALANPIEALRYE